MARNRQRRTKRNDPCPCGSGKKFKKCHGAIGAPALESDSVRRSLVRQEASELLRRSQQGHGRPIISAQVRDYRFVAVGDRLHYSKGHKTFVDFLGDYIKQVLTPEWGNAEIKKSLVDRHPVLQWYDALCRYQHEHINNPGEIASSPMTGVITAYYGLAYNLYLLQHNVEVRDHLVRRLKIEDSFYGAYYETFVAAWFILAGFRLALENEEDPSATHCEFAATRQGRSYSVEAKTRAEGKSHLDVGNQLYAALRKRANSSRIVFLDLNVSSSVTESDLEDQVVPAIKNREPKLKIRGEPAPSAYVLVTNNPAHLHLDEQNVPRAIMGVGFKIPDFGHGVDYSSLIAAHKAHERHSDVIAVMNACRDYVIPTTFEGEIPEFAFGEAERRFFVGERYEVEQGVYGVLTSGIVSEAERRAYLAFGLEDGRGIMMTAELSDPEISAYRQHPETFFGAVAQPTRKIDDPIDLFEFFYNSYKESPRETILEFFEGAPDIETLAQLSDDDLRMAYAERCTLLAMQRRKTGGAG